MFEFIWVCFEDIQYLEDTNIAILPGTNYSSQMI